MGDMYKRRSLNKKGDQVVHKDSGRDTPAYQYFLRCRTDLKGKMLEEQYQLFNDLSDLHILYHAISCGRGFGKTMISGSVALYFADEYSTKIGKALNVLIVSSQTALFDNLTTFFRNRPDLVERLVVRSPVDLIPKSGAQFKDNLSWLKPAMSTVHSVEGNRADIIIIDETQDVDEAVITKAMGCLRKDTIGKFIVVGTPYTEKKGVNWFIELVKNPTKAIGVKFHLTQHGSSGEWNDTKLWKAAWDKQRWNAEGLGVITQDEEKSYFGASNVRRCALDVPADPEGGMNSTREVGIDCGYHNTTYILSERIGSTKRKILYIGLWKDKSIEEIAPEIGKLLNIHDPAITKIDSKTGSIADYRAEIKKYTYKSIVKIDAAKMIKQETGAISTKECMRGQLLRKCREGTNLIIPTRLPFAGELVKQMLKYNIKHKEGDDLVDSLMLSCYEPPKGSLGGNGRISIMTQAIHSEGPWKQTGKYGL